MSSDKNYDDPFQDPFDDQTQQDPFIEDHFGGQQGGGGHNQGNSNRQGQEALPDATAVLVLGILSILGAFCYGVVGLILGILSVALSAKPMRLYRANPARYSVSSYNNLNAGKICGIIGLCLSVLIVLVAVVAILIAINDVGSYRY